MIELVMVIVILGIVSITIGPKFFNSSTLDERGFYEDFRQSLRYARDIALARGCSVQAVIYSNDFYMMQDANCDSSVYARATYTQPLMRPDESEKLEFANTHAEITTADYILVFKPEGEIWRDTNGVLNTVASLTVTIGSRSVQFYGDTGFIE